MKKSDYEGLKEGQKLFVSYKGIRPCEFKNLRGRMAFIKFDREDGKGFALHRVLASTLLFKAEKEKTAETPKVAPKAEKLPSISDEMLLRLLADRLGYELRKK